MSKEELDAARPIISCAELSSIRISKSKFVSSPEVGVEVELATKSRSKATVVSSELLISFELALRGYKEKAVSIEFQAKIDVIYSIPPESEFSELQLEAFSRSNGMLNVWPYWRQFVQNSTLNAGLPPLTLPLFRVLHKR